MPKKNPSLAGVEDYPVRSYEDAKAPEVEEAPQVDQIKDYHKDNPTLDTSGKEHDPEFQSDLLAKAERPEPAQR